MKPKYHTIEELLALIDEPYRSTCLRILQENREVFEAAPGSSHNHQAWPGGYLDHLVEAMNIAVVTHGLYGSLRPLQFSLSDALLILFLHDIEKPWKYEHGPDGTFKIKKELEAKRDQRLFRDRKLNEWSIELTQEQQNAMAYAEGERDDYSPQGRTMSPLAAFCNLCDTMSARLWPEHPLAKDDPWTGAVRSVSETA